MRYSASYLFGGEINKKARIIAAEYSLYGADEGTELSVIQYWVTADGTVVYGTERCITVGRYGIEE